jgi:putative transposase
MQHEPQVGQCSGRKLHSLKTECVYHERYLTRDEANKSIFDYIELFYNRQRRHSYLGYKTPEQYELSCSS